MTNGISDTINEENGRPILPGGIDVVALIDIVGRDEGGNADHHDHHAARNEGNVGIPLGQIAHAQ